MTRQKRRHHHRCHPRPPRVATWIRFTFKVRVAGRTEFETIAVEISKRNIKMDVTVAVGHVIDMTIAFLDQNGNPMLVTPTADAPPVWSNVNPNVETVVAAADGLSAEATPTTAGVDTVNVSAVVGGKTFTASLSVSVEAAPQVLTSIAIIPTVV